MDSKSTLLAIICLLAMVLLVQGNDNETRHDMEGKANRRYKRMYVMCPPKFDRIGNECYYISGTKQNWLDAYFECKDHNSKLAEPMKYEDKRLRRQLQKMNLSEDLWIGGTYNWKVNKWQWGHNGRDIEYQSFSQMVPGGSKDLKYNCALLRSELKFRWSAAECTKKMNFICQHRMPLVSASGRFGMYDKWNKTYPNQLANEKMVYIMNDPNNRNRSNNAEKPRIFNSVKRVLQSNPSIKPRPEHRRKPYQARKPVDTTGRYHIPPEVVVGRKQHLAQYAPDNPNDINTIDNGHRNGYHHSGAQFNVDFNTRNGNNRVAGGLPSSYRLGHGAVRVPHQHRHQPGLHKTTKRTHYYMPTRPTTTPSTTIPTTTTSTTTTTTTTTPRPQTSNRPTPTMGVPYFPLANTNVLKQHTAHPMTSDERKTKRERLRERLQRLSFEEQQLFFQDRAKRKKLKEQLLRNQQSHRENEVVQ